MSTYIVIYKRTKMKGTVQQNQRWVRNVVLIDRPCFNIEPLTFLL
jgi:hypothetical protein